MISILEKSVFFHSLTRTEITQITEKLKGNVLTFEKGSFIFEAYGSKPMTGIMLAGEAQVIKESYEGDTMIIESLVPGNLFGETYAFLKVPAIPVSVRAVKDAKCLMLDIEELMALGIEYKQIIENMLQVISEKNVLLNTKMSFIIHKTIRGRVEAYLFEQARLHNSNRFEIPFNRNEMADYLCIDRSALSRELSKMKKEGLIDYHRNTFELIMS